MGSLLKYLLIRPLKQRRNARRLSAHAPAGIYEERFVAIGGSEQWITLRGQERANPVLLLIHGGPGMPATPYAARLIDWEAHLTIVQWHQPGTAKTFRQNNGAEGTGPLSFERLAAAGLELATYVLEQLEQQQLILLADGAGAITATLMAQQRPELFAAYVGVDPHGSAATLDAVYAQILERATSVQDEAGLALLDAMGADKARWTVEQYDSLNKLGVRLTTEVPSVLDTLIEPAVMFDPQLSLLDMMYLDQGMTYSMEQLFEPLKTYDLSRYTALKLPVFLYQGEFDLLTPRSVVQSLFEQLEAPHKTLGQIDGVGALGLFADPAQFLRILREQVLPVAQAQRERSTP